MKGYEGVAREVENSGKTFFPMFIDLSKKKVVVIGGGHIAGRRIRTLLSFAGQICVIAPEVTEEIEGYIKEGWSAI